MVMFSMKNIQGWTKRNSVHLSHTKHATPGSDRGACAWGPPMPDRLRFQTNVIHSGSLISVPSYPLISLVSRFVRVLLVVLSPMSPSTRNCFDRDDPWMSMGNNHVSIYSNKCQHKVCISVLFSWQPKSTLVLHIINHKWQKEKFSVNDQGTNNGSFKTFTVCFILKIHTCFHSTQF